MATTHDRRQLGRPRPAQCGRARSGAGHRVLGVRLLAASRPARCHDSDCKSIGGPWGACRATWRVEGSPRRAVPSEAVFVSGDEALVVGGDALQHPGVEGKVRGNLI
jgi:hypothetical protein